LDAIPHVVLISIDRATESKREKIVELLDKIEERLSELEEEKKELKEFNNFDRERRCLEYALYARDLEDVDETLEQVRSV
jgi:structural maintenance of chromosome 3 (chondroitin sulfate proteoglycan 6)